MSKKEKIIDRSLIVQIGLGVLLYFLLSRPNEKQKVENKPVDVKGNDNEVTKGVKLEVNNPSIIRIDPSVNITRFFKNGEYFGKQRREVPKEHYENWEKLSNVLSYFRAVFKKPIIIAKGYSAYKDGKGAIIRPQNNDHNGLWNSIMLFMETNRNIARSVQRLSNKWVEVKI